MSVPASTTVDLMRILGLTKVPTETAHALARELLARNTSDKIRGVQNKTRGDRGALLRMAGNIAAGVAADQATRCSTPEQIAAMSVLIALRIVETVDQRLAADEEK